jgi:FtsZ-binding cell division protein ZapB
MKTNMFHHKNRPFVFIGMFALCFSGWAQDKTRTDRVFEAHTTTATILLHPTDAFQGFQVKVSGPDGLYFDLNFAGDETPELKNVDPHGQALPEGLYHYEIVAAPILDEGIERLLQDARANGDWEMIRAMRKAGDIPSGKIYSGTFYIAGGEIVLPESGEAVAATKGSESGASRPDDADPGNNDIIHGDDVIINGGSLCVGFDCVNGEVFGADTIRLKENNLRIHFDDTSVAGSYPRNDWRIVANDQANGGASYLGFEDSTAGRIPFRVTAGARSNALFVDSQGDVGIGTSTPVVELHVVSGDSPALRLEQNNASGFQPQTWDIAGNETNWFVRDASNGSTLPLRIRPGAPSSSVFIQTTGDVGINTASPGSTLHVRGTDGDTQLLVEEANTTDAVRNMLEVLNAAGPAEIRINTGTTAGDPSDAWIFRGDNGSNNLYIDQGNDASEEFRLDSNGNLTITGDLTANGNVFMSDRNMKEEFQIVDPTTVLDRVSALPITTWNFINDEEKTRHMGPMAQDFHAAFGLGKDETRIHSTDTFGVTLAAIQGLNLKVTQREGTIEALTQESKALREQNQTLHQQNLELQRRLEQLERIVSDMQSSR